MNADNTANPNQYMVTWREKLVTEMAIFNGKMADNDAETASNMSGATKVNK